MKSPWVLIALSLLLLAVGCRSGDVSNTLFPTPETESAFLKNYTPTNVLNRFNDGQGSSSGGKGASAGYDSVTHMATFQEYFAVCSDKFMPMMDALSDDVATQLVGNGAHIISQIGEASAGFHFDYKLGKTVGSVTISPLELTPLLGQQMPRPCMVGVHTRIDVAEEWFPKDRA